MGKTWALNFVLTVAALIVFALFHVNRYSVKEQPIPVFHEQCQQCGSRWESLFKPTKPMTHCPNCPLSEEEFEEAKRLLRTIEEIKQQEMKKNDYLQTPVRIWKPLGPFDLDPCAGESTEIGRVNWCDSRGENGLERNWFGQVFVNPPFSQKQLWIEKMVEHGKGVLILPERGSAPWFGPLAISAGRYFVMGKKISFVGGSSSNNVGSCIFPFGKKAIKKVLESGLPGHFVTVKKFVSREKSIL